MKTPRLWAALLVIGGLLMGPETVMSEIKTGSFPVTAIVRTHCTIGSATLAFGDIGLHTLTGTGTEARVTGNADASASVNVSCPTGITGSVTFDTGANPSGTTFRQMKSPSTLDVIPYHLYSDSGRTMEIGLTGATAYTVVGSGTPSTFTVYGRVVRSEVPNPAPATDYIDTVTMTITY